MSDIRRSVTIQLSDRSPARAADAARADRAAGRWPTRAAGDLPALPTMWRRWAALSAAFVAVGSERGPRMGPGRARFETARGSGCTLYPLPGDRAVLSGGVQGAPPLPAPGFTGAPEWVADPVLDARAGTGELTFCFWWEAGQWYRGESPSAADCDRAVPGVWTTDTVADIIAGLTGGEPGEPVAEPVSALLAAAGQGVVTRDALTAVFGPGCDLDGAWQQLTLAGLGYALPPAELPKQEAIARARRHLAAGQAAAGHAPPPELAADRMGVGWLVYPPDADGGIPPFRDVCYVDDDGDGLLGLAPAPRDLAGLIADCERRFRARHAPGDPPPGG